MAEAKSDQQPIAADGGGFFGLGRPKLRLTSEYDSDTSVFLQKVSCKLLDNIAKLKLSFYNNSKGEVSEPQITFSSKFFSLQYDVEESDAVLKTSLEIVPGVQLRAAHQFKVLFLVEFWNQFFWLLASINQLMLVGVLRFDGGRVLSSTLFSVVLFLFYSICCRLFLHVELRQFLWINCSSWWWIWEESLGYLMHIYSAHNFSNCSNSFFPVKNGV